MATGSFTRFCDWRFVHRARLNLLPVNSVSARSKPAHQREAASRCRRCGQQAETLPHVLNHCMRHSRAYTARHNSVVDAVVRAVPQQLGEVALNHALPEYGPDLRPDIVIRDNNSRTAHIIDVTIPSRTASTR